VGENKNMPEIGGAVRAGVLALTIKDRPSLYASYMPFLKGGGLFIPTNRAYHMGEDVFLLVTLPGETEKVQVAGKIAWMTPVGARGNRTAGVGVQFTDKDAVVIRNRIEAILGTALKSERQTHTM
jgi:type IV pilus assembly protein PilZ